MCAGGKPLAGLEACASPNKATLPDGCLGAQPAIGIDQFGLWCAPAQRFQIQTPLGNRVRVRASFPPNCIA